MTMKIERYILTHSSIKHKLTFAIVSDFHNSHNWQRIVESIPKGIDAILMPGDFCVRYIGGKMHNIKPFLQKAREIAPVFCSLGNHDVARLGVSAFEAMMTDLNCTPLVNEGVWFKDVWIAGWYRFKNSEFNLESLCVKDRFSILLSHKPEWYFSDIKALPFSLVISGHAHGGQIRLFNQGIFSSGQGLLPKYTHGIYDDRLIVTSGVGNPIHLPRFGNPKEIVLLTLKPLA